MAEMGTDTASETPEVVETQETQATETAEHTAADTETAAEETGEETGITEEKTPEQIEIDERAAAIAKSKAGTDPVIQKRIDKLTRQAKIEAENAYLRGQLEAVEKFGLKPQTQHVEAPEVETPPNPYDYDLSSPAGVAAYHKDSSDWNFRDASRKAETAQQRKAQQAEQAKAAQAFDARVNEVVESGRKVFEDFDEVTGRNSILGKVMNPVLAHAILESGEMAPYVEYHLGSNEAEAKRIAELALQNPVKAIKEIDKLEKQLMAARQPKTTQAPAPVKPLKGGAQLTVDESKMSDDDYFKLEKQRLAEKRKGRV